MRGGSWPLCCGSTPIVPVLGTGCFAALPTLTQCCWSEALSERLQGWPVRTTFNDCYRLLGGSNEGHTESHQCWTDLRWHSVRYLPGSSSLHPRRGATTPMAGTKPRQVAALERCLASGRAAHEPRFRASSNACFCLGRGRRRLRSVQGPSSANDGGRSPSQLAKNQIEIAGHLYVCGRYLASMLGISERTLSRRFADGNGPPHVKLARIYYDLNKVQEWTAEKPQRRGLCGQKQEILDRECVADLAGLEAATIRQKKRLLCAGRIVDRVAARKPVSQTDGPISDG